MRSEPTARLGTILTLMVVLLAHTATSATRATEPTTRPSTRPETTAPVPSPKERLLAIRDATLAALAHAKENGGKIPTTEQLAERMEVPLAEFQFVVVPTGQIQDHSRRISGWPEVLVREKHGGMDEQWAFGFVDGMCTIQTEACFEEMGIETALKVIKKTKESWQ